MFGVLLVVFSCPSYFTRMCLELQPPLYKSLFSGQPKGTGGIHPPEEGSRIKDNTIWKRLTAGGLAGLVNGFFGGGGGMILVPFLVRKCGLSQRQAFATSIAVILPLCVLSSVIYWLRDGLELAAALPYLAGGLIGGFLGGRLFKRLSMVWLRKVFALFILYGAVNALL